MKARTVDRQASLILFVMAQVYCSSKLLTQQGSLSKVWLVGHGWEKGISKRDVQQTNITSSIKDIVSPSEPLGLRVSGQLLLGIVKIFEKKLKYLQEDASHALAKIKFSFHPNVSISRNDDATLTDKQRQAQISKKERSITLPTHMGDIDIDMELLDLPIDKILEEMEMSGELNEDLEFEWKLREAQSEQSSRLGRMSMGQYSMNDAGSIDLEMPRDAPDGLRFDLNSEIDLAPMNMDLEDLPHGDFSMKGDMSVSRRFPHSFADVSFGEQPSIHSIHMNNPFGEEPSLDIGINESIISHHQEKKKKLERFDKQTQIHARKFSESATSKLVVENKAEIIEQLLLKKSNYFLVDNVEAFERILKNPSGIDHTIASALQKYFEEEGPIIQVPLDESHVSHVQDEVEVNMASIDAIGAVPEIDFDDPSMLMYDEGMPDFNHDMLEGSDSVPIEPIEEETPRDEGGWSEKTFKAYELIKQEANTSKSGTVSLNNLLEGKSRLAASILFHETLVLKSKNMVQTQQTSPYEDIQVTITTSSA